MNIPDEAVDAAVDALLGSTFGDRLGVNGEEFVEAARAALEAAAPHIAFAVLEEAALSAEEQEYDHITPRALRRRARSYRRESHSSDD